MHASTLETSRPRKAKPAAPAKPDLAKADSPLPLGWTGTASQNALIREVMDWPTPIVGPRTFTCLSEEDYSPENIAIYFSILSDVVALGRDATAAAISAAIAQRLSHSHGAVYVMAVKCGMYSAQVAQAAYAHLKNAPGDDPFREQANELYQQAYRRHVDARWPA